MNRDKKVRNCLVIGFAISLLMPVYNTVLFGQNFHMSIFEHATLGTFLSIFWLVLIVLMLYVIHFQKKFISIIDWIFLLAGVFLVVIVVLGKSANPFTFKYGFIVQIIIIVAYILNKFAQDIMFKILDTLHDLWKKVAAFLQKLEVQDQSSTSESTYEQEPQEYYEEEPFEDPQEEKNPV